MPQFDHTGPQGQGSRTGRQMGKCNPVNKTNQENNITEKPRRKFLGLRWGMQAPDENMQQTNGQQNRKGLGRGMGQGKGRRGGNSFGKGNK